jgi:replicative DNA helicase
MSRVALGKRVLQFATGSGEDDWKLQPQMISEDIEKHFFDKAPIYVVESCGTMERAAASIRQHVEQHGVKLVLVDYGQLLQSRGNSKYEQTSATSIALRQITNELKITSIVLCQLNRSVDGRDKAIPRMGDLRDSGQLEQDADVIVFLCWPHRVDSTKPEHEYQMFIAKNRSRPIVVPALQCRFYPNRQMLRAEESTVINGVKLPEDF